MVMPSLFVCVFGIQTGGLKLTQQTLSLLGHLLSPSLLLLTHYEFQKNTEAEQLSLFFS